MTLTRKKSKQNSKLIFSFVGYRFGGICHCLCVGQYILQNYSNAENDYPVISVLSALRPEFSFFIENDLTYTSMTIAFISQCASTLITSLAIKTRRTNATSMGTFLAFVDVCNTSCQQYDNLTKAQKVIFSNKRKQNNHHPQMNDRIITEPYFQSQLVRVQYNARNSLQIHRSCVRIRVRFFDHVRQFVYWSLQYPAYYLQYNTNLLTCAHKSVAFISHVTHTFIAAHSIHTRSHSVTGMSNREAFVNIWND